MTIASPKGGKAPLDPSSVKMFESDPVSKAFLDNHEKLWTNTHKLADMVPRAGEFDAIFYVGGHGRMLTPAPPIQHHIHDSTTIMRREKLTSD